MHCKGAILFLVCFKVICLQTNDLVNILESEKNFFQTINKQLHILTNKLFSSLKLTYEFTEKSKVKVLLAMHSDLNNVAEKYGNSYDDIQSITSSKIIGNITDLEKLFKEIIFYDKDDLIKKVVNVTNPITKTNDTFEFKLESIVDKVLDRILTQPARDVLVISKTHRNNFLKPAIARYKTREIKVWQSSISSTSTENITRRIYKGKKTHIKKYPFLVSIHLKNEFSCAGSIISKDLVITAATCLQTAYNISGKLPHFSVRVGSDYTNRLGEMIPVTEIFFHPGYTPETLQNNIAIMKIKKRVKFSKKRKIQRIQYAMNENIDDAQSVTIMGWGAKDTNQENFDTRRVSVAHLDVYDFGECGEIYTRYYVTDKNFCAGFVAKGGGACNRDVGGPAVMSGMLVGIISFGPLVCGMTSAPTVFTKVGCYAEWINDVITQKPQMRKTENAKTLLEKPVRAFPMPKLLLTTLNTIPPATTTSDFPYLTTERTYPADEITILREILQEVVFSNNSIMDYILYGDELPKENDARNIPKTTKKVHQITNKSKFQNYRQKMPSRIKPVKLLIDKNNDDNTDDYEDTETGIKILESLVGRNAFNGKLTTPKRFHVSDNMNLKYQAFDKVINSVEYAKETDKHDSKHNIPNDSSSYYEDDTGLTIETTEEHIDKNIGREDYHVKKATTSKIKLENYKNVIFSLNPLRESRDIITIDRKQYNNGVLKNADNKIGNVNPFSTTSKKNAKHIMNIEDYTNPLRDRFISVHNQKKYGESKIAIVDKDRTHKQKNYQENNSKGKTNTKNAPIGLTMAISDEDFDYDKMYDKQEYVNNMRSRYDEREPVRWRFRSRP